MILENPLPADVIPVCLPEEDAIGDDETLTITGFGTIIEGKVLHQSNFKIRADVTQD